MNKKIKIIIFNVLLGTILFGAYSGTRHITKETKIASALSTQTISEITGFTRVAGQNSKTFIRFAANEVVGTYEASYVGNVFTGDGTALPLVLYPNGGTGGATWANGGTRQFELKTDSTDFINAIGSGTTFYLTKDSKFTDGSTEITFAKEYVFTSIYDGNCKINEIVPTVCSFDIKEVNNRPESTKIRVGVNEFSNLAAGFGEKFEADIVDSKNTVIHATISDAASGSSSAGNRLVNIVLSKQTTNIIAIPNGTKFVCSTNLTKILVLKNGYRLDATTAANYRVDAVGSASDFATIANNALICNASGSSQPTFNSPYSWDVLRQVSLALDSQSKTELNSWSSSSSEIVKTFMSKYDYILAKYGTTAYADFLNLGGYQASAINSLNYHASYNYLILVASLTLLTVAIFLTIKKKVKAQ